MNLTQFYSELDKISERICDAMTVDAAGDIEDEKSREIAVNYIRAACEKQLEDTKRYLRAYRDFK